jgi:hypothetical protein
MCYSTLADKLKAAYNTYSPEKYGNFNKLFSMDNFFGKFTKFLMNPSLWKYCC